MNQPPDQPPFLVRHPWLLVALAFAILLGAWATLIMVATHHAPQVIEVSK